MCIRDSYTGLHVVDEATGLSIGTTTNGWNIYSDIYSPTKLVKYVTKLSTYTKTKNFFNKCLQMLHHGYRPCKNMCL